MSRIRWYGPTLLLMLTLVLAMLLGPAMVRQIAQSYETARIAQVRQGLVDNPTLSTLSEAFKDVATVVRPSVTSISLQARDRSSDSSRLVNISNGSGWVYRYYINFQADPDDYDDYIITNHHVVEDYIQRRAEQVVVRFDDGGEYRATLVGTDPKTDVAVLKIKHSGLFPAALASEPAVQGEIVFAIGSPFHLDFSMSQGIVSATGRTLRGGLSDNYENFIQTDAAINPGNSGGPLTNVRGQVIGMNTAIVLDGDDAAHEFSGVGFAIPIQQIVNVADQLIENGEVNRGYIGVYTNSIDIDFATAREMGFTGKGVLAHPAPGAPADLAGMQLGDIITHVDGTPVRTSEELRITVSSHPPGIELTIRIWRRGRPVRLQVTLAEYPDGFGLRRPRRGLDNPFEPQPDSTATAAGLGRFESMTPALATQLGWAYTPGVLVRLIEDDSAAERQGLVRMSVITQVNGQPIHDLPSFAQALDQGEANTLTVTVKKWNPTGEGRYDGREVVLTP